MGFTCWLRNNQARIGPVIVQSPRNKMYVTDLKREFYDNILGKVNGIKLIKFCFINFQLTLVLFCLASNHLRELWRRCNMLVSYSAVPSPLWYHQLFYYSSAKSKRAHCFVQRELWAGNTIMHHFAATWTTIVFFPLILGKPHYSHQLWWNNWHCSSPGTKWRKDFLHCWFTSTLWCLQHL